MSCLYSILVVSFFIKSSGWGARCWYSGRTTFHCDSRSHFQSLFSVFPCSAYSAPTVPFCPYSTLIVFFYSPFRPCTPAFKKTRPSHLHARRWLAAELPEGMCAGMQQCVRVWLCVCVRRKNTPSVFTENHSIVHFFPNTHTHTHIQ